MRRLIPTILAILIGAWGASAAGAGAVVPDALSAGSASGTSVAFAAGGATLGAGAGVPGIVSAAFAAGSASATSGVMAVGSAGAASGVGAVSLEMGRNAAAPDAETADAETVEAAPDAETADAEAAQKEKVTFEVAAPMIVEVGEMFRIEFVVANAAPENIKFAPPTIEGFEVLAGPQSSYATGSSNINGVVSRTEITTYTYVLQGLTAGMHTISAAKVTIDGKAYSTDPVTIEVAAGGGSGAGQGSGVSGQGSGSGNPQGAGQGGTGEVSGQEGAAQVSDTDIFLRATVDRTDVYKDEPIVLTLKLYTRINSELGEHKIPTFNGFWQLNITSDQTVQQRETYNGRVYTTYVLLEYLLYPQQPGQLSIEPFELNADIVVQIGDNSARSMFDQLMGGGPMLQQVRKRLVSQPVRINVRDLPVEGRPASFDGAVGEFRLTSTPPPSAMSANQSGTYTLRLEGTGNFPLVRAPKLTLPQSFEEYNVTTTDNIRNTRGGTSGYKEFAYPFIPRSEGLYTIPTVEFSYFDPQKRRYETLSSPEISIEVAADSTSVSSGGLVSGVSREDLRVFGEDIRFMKRGRANLRREGNVFMFSTLYFSLVALLVVLFVAGILFLPRYVRNMQSDHFVRGKRANKVALRRFRNARVSMAQGDRHSFHDEMLKALWGYAGDKFDIPMADLNKERIREELFERSVPQSVSDRYVKIISECEEAQYSPSTSARMGELYDEGVALISEMESAIKRPDTNRKS